MNQRSTAGRDQSALAARIGPRLQMSVTSGPAAAITRRVRPSSSRWITAR